MGKRAPTRPTWPALVLLGLLLLVACGGDPPSRSAQNDPVSLLVARGDLGPEWVMDRGTTNGKVPVFEEGPWGPQPLACDARPADPELTVEWEARRAFEMFDRPAEVPSGEEARMYRVRVEEVLLTGSARSVERLYDAFVSGMDACAAVLPGSDYSGETVALELPPVGDARSGIDMSFRAKDEPVSLAGTLRTVVVREGKVLMLVTLSEDTYAPSRDWRPQRQVDDAALAEILTTMVGHLG